MFAYYLAPVRLKNTVLLAASLFFYAWGEPVYIFLMLFSIVINYIAGIITGDAKSRKVKIPVLAAAVILNVFMLGFFKYADFVTEGINSIFGLGIKPLELPRRWYIVLYVSGDLISCRCVQGRCKSSKKYYRFRNVYIDVSAAHSGTHHKACGYRRKPAQTQSFF